MAIPQLPGPQVETSPAPDAQVRLGSSPETFGAGVGQAIEGVGQVIDRAAEEAKNIRVNDQINQIQERSLDLAFGKDGYRTVQGGNVLKMPNGQSLTQTYAKQFEDSATQARNALTTPQQQALFDRRMLLIRRNFMRGLEGHEQEQIHLFGDETDKATIDTQANAATQFWNDPLHTETATGASDAAWASLGQRNGWPAAKIDQMQQQSRSALYGKVLTAALDAGNYDYASGYLKRYASDMLPDDLTRAAVMVNGKRDDALAFGAAQQASKAVAAQQRQVGGSFGNLSDAVATIESSNRQSGPDGQPIISSAGAVGRMQVMPATAEATAKAHGIPYDADRLKTDAAYNTQIGQLVLQDNLQHFAGDPQMVEKAVAAYNSNPKTVDEAQREAALPENKGLKNSDGSLKTWVDYLPPQTQAYLPKVMAKMNGLSVAAQPQPTLKDYTDAALAIAGAQGPLNPVQVEKVTKAAEQQFNIDAKSREQEGQNAFDQGMKALQSGTPYDQLPLDLIQKVPGKNLPELQRFAKTLAEGSTVKTDLGVYQLLAQNPNRLAQMGDAEFNALQTKLDPGDFKHFATERASLLQGGSKSIQNLNSTLVNPIVDQMMLQQGIQPRPMNSDTEGQARVGLIRKTVTDNVLALQAAAGRQLNETEVRQAVGRLFMQQAPMHHFIGADTAQSVLSLTYDDIPDANLKLLQGVFAKRGYTPTKQEILGAYQQMMLLPAMQDLKEKIR